MLLKLRIGVARLAVFNVNVQPPQDADSEPNTNESLAPVLEETDYTSSMGAPEPYIFQSLSSFRRERSKTLADLLTDCVDLKEGHKYENFEFSICDKLFIERY